MLRRILIHCVLLMSAAPSALAAPARWDFSGGADGWTAANDCTVAAVDGVLRVASSGPDPFIHSPDMRVEGPAVVRMRAKFATHGQARLYWRVLLPSLVPSPWSASAVLYFDVLHDNQWHDLAVPLDVDGTVTQIRLDPGKGPGTAEIDWIAVEPLAALAAGQGARVPAVTVADGPIQVTVDPAARTFAVRDARTGRRWRSVSARTVGIPSARKVGPDGLELVVRDLASGLEATCRVQAQRTGGVTFALNCDRPEERFIRLAFPPALREALDDGALVFTDRSCGQLIGQTVTDYPISSLGSYANIGLDMPWVGVVDRRRGDGLMVLLETPCDAAVDFQRDRQGRMWPQVRWLPAKGQWAYSRTMSYRFTPSGGYVAQAQAYRSYAESTGLAVTLATKARARPRVADLRGTASIWVMAGGADRIAPPVRVAQELKAFGISRAILNFWHWSAAPDADIPAVNALGFLTCEYDDYDDLREGPNDITSGPVELQAVRNADGTKAAGWLGEDGTQLYRRSSAVAVDVAREIVPAIQRRRPFSARFLDVSAAMDLAEDWDARHAYDRRGDLANRLRLYRYINSLGLVVGGEHVKAWCVPVVDYAEGKLSGPFWWEMPAIYLKAPKTRDDLKPNYLRWGVNPAVRVPLWELAFHDCMVSTWHWSDCSGYYTEVAPELDDFQDLSAMLYGDVPIFWLKDLGYGWNRHRGRMLESYWVSSKLHEATGFDRMVSHRFVTPDGLVQETRFSGGGVVTVNFADKPYQAPGAAAPLAPRGFLASAAGVRQSRTLVDGSPVTLVRSGDCLMVRTEKQQTVGPVTVRGRVFMFPAGKGRTHVVVESGEQCSIELGPGTHRVARLDDAGAPAEPFRVVSGTLRIPGRAGVRLFGVDGA